MPKARKGGAGASSWLSVSPWHDKARDKEAAPEAAEGAEAAYHVVELPWSSAEPKDSGSGKGNGSEPAASAGTRSGPAAANPADLQHPSAPSAAPAAPSSAQWQVKKRKKESGEYPAASALAEGRAVPSAAGGAGGGASMDLDSEGEFSELAGTPAGEDALEGVGVLAALPNGNVTGHFLPHGSRQRSIGLMGQEVLAYRDCTRDAEWRVLRMTAIDFSRGGREASFLVERTEGDAMRLRAPIVWQGTEEDTQEQLSQGCEPSMALEFHCERLLVEAAAEAELRLLQPSLCGRGALVNVGALKLTWPQIEGGSSAAVPAGSMPPPLPRPRSSQPGGQALASGDRVPERRRGLTSGPGSGRVVRDSEELW